MLVYNTLICKHRYKIDDIINVFVIVITTSQTFCIWRVQNYYTFIVLNKYLNNYYIDIHLVTHYPDLIIKKKKFKKIQTEKNDIENGA